MKNLKVKSQPQLFTYTIQKVKAVTPQGKRVHYSVEQYNNGKFVDAWGFDTRSEALDYINQDSLFFIESEIKKIQIKKEKLDSEYKKLLWNKIKKHTYKLEDLPKAASILNNYHQTVSTLDLFSKLRSIKTKLNK